MHEAEKIGIERGAKFVTLNTMDWEGLVFYQELGCAIEFVREDYEEGDAFKDFFQKRVNP